MRFFGNEKGIALVTSLMFTMLALVITTALLYMVTSGIKSSGIFKRYKTVNEATYGGTDIMVKDLISATFGFNDYSSAHPGTNFTTYMKNSYMVNLSNPDVSGCLRIKLTQPKSMWGTCNDATFNVKQNYDVAFNLNSASGMPFRMYSKIVDTMDRKLLTYNFALKTGTTVTIAGNSDTSSGAILEGASTTEASTITIPHYPYLYRIEIQGERATNPAEKANISVQYAY